MALCFKTFSAPTTMKICSEVLQSSSRALTFWPLPPLQPSSLPQPVCLFIAIALIGLCLSPGGDLGPCQDQVQISFVLWKLSQPFPHGTLSSSVAAVYCATTSILGPRILDLLLLFKCLSPPRHCRLTERSKELVFFVFIALECNTLHRQIRHLINIC